MQSHNWRRKTSSIRTMRRHERRVRRVVMVSILGLVIAPFVAQAQVIKEVVVTNLPAVQDVHVVNQSPSTPQGGTVQIIGVTTEVYTGDLGGPWGATEKCDEEFSGTRMCSLGEARRSLPPFPVIPAQGAWTDPDLNISNFNINSRTCGDWTSSVETSSNLGIVTIPNGAFRSLGCHLSAPIACCGPVP